MEDLLVVVVVVGIFAALCAFKRTLQARCTYCGGKFLGGVYTVGRTRRRRCLTCGGEHLVQ